jgi:hemolysin D
MLRSPIAGTVQQVTVTTIGQVVTTGQVLMTVVPANAPVEVVGMVANKDAGFLDVGQRAIVKVDAYPFTRYGTLDAEVVRIARESVAEKDVAAGPAGLPSPRAGGQSLVFPVTLRLLQPTLRVDGRDLPLTPGLTVTAEVTTGQRRVIDFVLSPIREAVGQAGRER